MIRFEDINLENVRYAEPVTFNDARAIEVRYYDDKDKIDYIAYNEEDLEILKQRANINRIVRNSNLKVAERNKKTMSEKQEVVAVPRTEKTYDKYAPGQLTAEEMRYAKANAKEERRKETKKNVKTFVLVGIGTAVLGGLLAVGKHNPSIFGGAASGVLNLFNRNNETTIEQEAEENTVGKGTRTVASTDMTNQYMTYDEVITNSLEMDADLENVLSRNGKNVEIDDESSLAYYVATNYRNIKPETIERLQNEDKLPEIGQDIVVNAYPVFDNAGHEDTEFMNNISNYRFEYANYIYDEDARELLERIDELTLEARKLTIKCDHGQFTEADVERCQEIYDLYMGWLKSQGTSELGNRNTYDEGVAKIVDLAGRDIIGALARLSYNNKPVITQAQIQEIVGRHIDPNGTGEEILNTMVNDWSTLIKDLDDCVVVDDTIDSGKFTK